MPVRLRGLHRPSQIFAKALALKTATARCHADTLPHLIVEQLLLEADELIAQGTPDHEVDDLITSSVSTAQTLESPQGLRAVAWNQSFSPPRPRSGVGWISLGGPGQLSLVS